MSLTSFLRNLFSSAEPYAPPPPPPPSRGEPLRLSYASLDEIPPAEELAALAAPGRHVGLHLAGLPREPVENLLHALEQRLPDHRVFVSRPPPPGRHRRHHRLQGHRPRRRPGPPAAVAALPARIRRRRP